MLLLPADLLDPLNYAANLLAIPVALTGVAMILFAALVLWRERVSPIGASLFWLSLLLGFWLFTSAATYSATSEAVASFWAAWAFWSCPS